VRWPPVSTTWPQLCEATHAPSGYPPKHSPKRSPRTDRDAGARAAQGAIATYIDCPVPERTIDCTCTLSGGFANAV
jgi:hypothetical protein